MILTCPQCQAQYNLAPAALGDTGRDVRCVACNHVWFQKPEAPAEIAEAPPVAVEAPEPESTSKSITDALNAILEKDDDSFKAALSNVAESTKTAPPPQREAPASPPPKAEKPEPKKQVEQKTQIVRQETVLPVVTHNPMGMGASVFGGMVFLLCSFITLAVVFAAKAPVMRHWPQTTLLYKTLGFDIKAPGEGIRFSEMTAERRIDSHGKALVVEGKMTNMTEHDIAYPALHVMMKDDGGHVAKEWDIHPGMTQIAAGDVVPVMLQLDSVPDEGSAIELHVKEK